METIRDEAARGANLSINLDTLRSRYMIREINGDTAVIFPSPEIFSYSINLFELLSACKKVDWKTSWTMRPDYVSKEMYGTVVFWNLILYVNNCFSMEDFKNLPFVLVPSYRSVLELTKDKIHENVLDVTPTDNLLNEVNFYKKYPLDEKEVSRMKAKESLDDEEPIIPDPPSLSEIQENIVVDADDVSNGYLLLDFETVSASSITLFIDDNVEACKYGYDFILLQDPSSKLWKKLSWLDQDCPFGSGLENVINEPGVVLKIRYVAEI